MCLCVSKVTILKSVANHTMPARQHIMYIIIYNGIHSPVQVQFFVFDLVLGPTWEVGPASPRSDTLHNWSTQCNEGCAHWVVL